MFSICRMMLAESWRNNGLQRANRLGLQSISLKLLNTPIQWVPSCSGFHPAIISALWWVDRLGSRGISQALHLTACSYSKVSSWRVVNRRFINISVRTLVFPVKVSESQWCTHNESVCRWNKPTFHCSASLMPLKTVSNSARFMRLSSCTDCNQLACVLSYGPTVLNDNTGDKRTCIHSHGNVLPIHTPITTVWVCLRCFVMISTGIRAPPKRLNLTHERHSSMAQGLCWSIQTVQDAPSCRPRDIHSCWWIYRQYIKKCRDLPTNVNRSDYSFALEKLHPGTTGNDKALFRL